ncbi:hypothetical protein TNCV_1585421 [Trichonephila clavipes]|nr:hypothetical protein TNCV_1585421 [Trichonephila clavipes]
MQASHLRFMERRTFDNISGVFRISPAAALMRATSSSALFTGVSYTKGFHLPPEEIIQTGKVFGEANALDLHGQSIVHHMLHQVIPNRNTEMCGGSILLEPHGSSQ